MLRVLPLVTISRLSACKLAASSCPLSPLAFPHHHFPHPIRTMASTASATSSTTAHQEPDPVAQILDFWFDPAYDFMRWFAPSTDLDSSIHDSFGPLITTARETTDLDAWTATPRGTLALLILLDQFPRNVHRGSPLAHASDAKALDVATKAVVKGFDRKVPLMYQPFFYLPFVHGEALLAQVAGKALYEGLVRRCGSGGGGEGHGGHGTGGWDLEQTTEFANKGCGFAQGHAEIVERFGRFPSRNKALGRENTKEEGEFLRDNPKGF